MNRPFSVEFTEEELAMVYSAIEYMRDGFEHDMVPRDDQEQSDLDTLPVLSKRIKNVIDTAHYCTQCDEAITDWTYTVEDNDGNPVCGGCDQGAVDQAHDEMSNAQQGRNGGK